MPISSSGILLGLTFSVLTLMTPLACTHASELPLAVDGEAALAAPDASTDFQALAAADVVYLGETHDSLADHAAQLEILMALHQQNPEIAIALEMFQRPFQPVIDRYLAGDISEAELVIQSEYEQRWGFPWEYYAPILRFAQEHQLPLIAANAPAEITRKVARQGLEALEGDDFNYIPNLADIDTSNADYRAFVSTAFSSHSAHGGFELENFFSAQVIWDETMAQSIVDFKQAHPETQVVVLAGKGHVAYGYGIPDRVVRRLGESVNQQIVLLNPPADITPKSEPNIADVFWYSED